MHHIERVARDRLDKFEEQIRSIERSEFLSASTSAALRCINDEVASLRSKLVEAAARNNLLYLHPPVITINQKIFNLTKYLGILLRSTNLRNNFEAYFSFEEMAFAFMGEADRLILSSEWDSIPFYIPSPPDALKGFVIIGIPAFASRNSLLLPLAAHELSHAVWRQKDLDSLLNLEADKTFRAEIDANERKFKRDFSLKNDLFSRNRKEIIVGECLKLVSAQCQEMFCDLLGASIFKESYVYAFDAFLTPGFGAREPSYPSFSNRAKYIIRAAFPNPGDVRTGVLDLGRESPQIAVDPIVQYADAVTGKLEHTVLRQARKFASLLPYENKEEGENAETMMRNLQNGIPPDNPRSPVDILNAIWRVYFDRLDLLAKVKDRCLPDKLEDNSKLWSLMNNLCLKSLEIYEYRHIQKYGTKHARITANSRGA